MATCPYCKEEIQEGAMKCKHCGEILQKETYNKSTNVIQDYSQFSSYWQEIFKIFDDNNGKFKMLSLGNTNAAATLFSPLWYAFKGMWLKFFIYLIVFSVTVAFTAGIGWLFWIVYFGIWGPYDYYLLTVKGKQLW
jgi:hypothetical protein